MGARKNVRLRLNLRLTPTICTTILSHMDTLAMDTRMLTIHMLLPNQLRLLKNPQLSLREKGVKLKLILQFLPLTPRSTTHCLFFEQLTPFQLLTTMESILD